MFSSRTAPPSYASSAFQFFRSFSPSPRLHYHAPIPRSCAAAITCIRWTQAQANIQLEVHGIGVHSRWWSHRVKAEDICVGAQSGASSVLAPALKYLADALALSWRKRLTSVAHRRYLTGSTFYGVSHLAGMQVSPGDRPSRTFPGAFRGLQGHSSCACIAQNLCAMLRAPATLSCCRPRDRHCNAADQHARRCTESATARTFSRSLDRLNSG